MLSWPECQAGAGGRGLFLHSGLIIGGGLSPHFTYVEADSVMAGWGPLPLSLLNGRTETLLIKRYVHA